MLYYSYLNCMIVLYFLFIAYVGYNFYAHELGDKLTFC
jgi:hypothetical protein